MISIIRLIRPAVMHHSTIGPLVFSMISRVLNIVHIKQEANSSSGS